MMMPSNGDRFYCEEYPDVVPRSYFSIGSKKAWQYTGRAAVEV